MYIYRPGWEEKRDAYGSVLTWLLVLLLGITLILGYVKYYDLTREIREKQQELTELQEALYEKKRQLQQEQADLGKMAEELGMYQPQPEEYYIINVE